MAKLFLRRWFAEEIRRAMRREVEDVLMKLEREGWETDEELDAIIEDFARKMRESLRWIKVRWRSVTYKG